MIVGTDKKLEDVLAEQGYLSPATASRLKVESINTGRSVEDLILSQNLVTEDVFLKTRSTFLGVPYIDIVNKSISSEVLLLVSELVARRYNLIPFEVDKQEKTVSVAMSDPLDLQVTQFLEQKTGYKVKTFLAKQADISKAINEQYSQSLTTEVTEALKESANLIEGEESLKDLEKAEGLIREAPVAKIVSTLLEYALKGRASDIHIEPQEDKTRIRFRIDGILQERLIIPKKVHEQLVTRVKILSNMKIDEKRLPQDGRFSFKLADQVVDLRISSLPSVHGEKIVMRLLPKSGVVPTLSELGLRGSGLRSLETAILKPHGIVLIAGPTGSGKTTTLFAVLSKLNSPKVNIITVEDPVEYEIPGVNQVQINPQAGLTFSSGLRSILRQDPNIIMVGEIRDRETADLAIQAALTGHLVFSTLHTNKASGALPRLLDMGAETFLIASSVSAVVAQRVVRMVCPSCKESYEPTEALLKDIQKNLGGMLRSPKVLLYRGKGCRECGESGYRGRTGTFEVLVVEEKIAKLILERTSSGEIEKIAIQNGMITLLQDGYLKALEGITTIEEVLRVSNE